MIDLVSLFWPAVVIGSIATLVMDVWGKLRARWFGVKGLDYGWVGRWFLALPTGTFVHNPAHDSPINGAERALGWALHYAIGMVFALVLLALTLEEGPRPPSVMEALLMGAITVLAPYLILQPALGAGVFASRSPSPWRMRKQALLNHLVFGFGLFLGGWIWAQLPEL